MNPYLMLGLIMLGHLAFVFAYFALLVLIANMLPERRGGA